MSDENKVLFNAPKEKKRRTYHRNPETLKYGEKTVVKSVRLPVSHMAKLQAIAADRGQRVNELINELIKNLK